MGYQDIEESRMYQLAEEIADEIWEIVMGWPSFAQQALGTQLVRKEESVDYTVDTLSGGDLDEPTIKPAN